MTAVADTTKPANGKAVDEPLKAAIASPPPRSLDDATFLSRWIFWWLNGLLTLGYRRPLQTDDVPTLPQAEQSKRMGERFEEAFRDIYRDYLPGSNASSSKSETVPAETATETKPIKAAAADVPLPFPPSLLRAIWRIVGWRYTSALIYAFISEILAFAGPMLTDRITSYLEDDSTEPGYNGWIYVACLFVLPSIASICRNAYFINSWRVAVQLRAALLTSVFRKSLKLSPAARKIVTDGEILTLMSADAQKLAEIWPVLYVLFTAPLSIIACFVLIWFQVGASTLAGAGMIAVLMPTNIWFGKKSGGYRREEAAQTDLRMRYVKEAVSNMKVIKQYGWSSSFENRITEVRKKEISIRRKAAYLEALSNSILILTPVLISLITFLTFAGSGHVLTATNVFTSMALFNVMRFQLSQFPLVLTALFEAKVSLARILRLFLREELQTDARDYQAGPLPEMGATVAKIDGCTFSWDQPEQAAAVPATMASAAPTAAGKKGEIKKTVGTDSNFRLTNINVDVYRGQFVAVVGAVGSGKSSLLQALLGEVARISGPKIFLRGRIAIVPQTAWILNMSLKKNILFGLEFKEEIYHEVLELCCLKADLAQLPAGDQTEIGDKGVNLSGGQKQRTAIARAVYAVLMGESDVLLIDDPLSAVDAHVSKALFDNVLSRTGVLGKKGITTILAMNQLHFLPQTDYVVVMKGGGITQQGTYQNLMLNEEGELASLMRSYGFKQDENEHKEGESEVDAPGTAASPAPGELVAVEPESTSPGSTVTDKPAVVAATEGEAASTGPAVSVTVAASTTALADVQKPADTTTIGKPDASKGKTTQAETRVEGSVGWNVYRAYIRASGGMWVTGTLLFLFCVHQSGRVLGDYWLAWWADQDWDNPEHTLAFWMGIFAIFGGVVTIASLIRSMMFAYFGLLGAYNLHQGMLKSIFRSPTSWFDVTPAGRVVNRFSGDVDKLDHMIVRIVEGYGGCVFFVLGTFVAICVVYPYFFAPLLVIIVIYWRVQQYYVATSRELQRLDNISKSPIFSHFGESLAGAASIRAFNASKQFHNLNEQFVDANHRNVLAYQGALCWLGVRIEFISTLLMTISAIFAVELRHTASASLVGLTIVYSITITSFLNFAVRLGSVVEGLMSSVERLDEYSVLPSEAEPRLPDDPDESWPKQGAIKFNDIVLRYRPELDVVLKGVSLSINPGEKIGIIGRTGSGKSSLTVALFRLVELASGNIEIDGVDIGKIGLETLRTRINLIPQEPTIFGSTVRYNLDPFGRSSDEDIWRVLKLVNLDAKIAAMDGKLDFVLSEGESLSVGERQLICVSRALLRQTNILILDEVSASVDVASDLLLQQVIAEQFASATVLAIAHRLSTIIDYDRILVMDNGNVAEFGVPHELMQNPNSALLSLVDATGPASAQHLKTVAREAYEAAQQGIKVRHRPTIDASSPTVDADTYGIEPSCVNFHLEGME